MDGDGLWGLGPRANPAVQGTPWQEEALAAHGQAPHPSPPQHLGRLRPLALPSVPTSWEPGGRAM